MADQNKKQYIKYEDTTYILEDSRIPDPSSADNGKVLGVVNGEYALKQEEGGGGGAVTSVNGKTGAVVLDAKDVGALPDSTGASMELIRSITFSEAAVLDITTDDNGQPLKLTQAILKITLGTVAANENMTVDAKNGNTSIARHYAGVKASTTGHIGTFYIWQKAGFWDSEFTAYAANGLASIQKQAQYAMRDSVQSYPFITRIMENNNHQFPSGTVVKLFGVRYKE